MCQSGKEFKAPVRKAIPDPLTIPKPAIPPLSPRPPLRPARHATSSRLGNRVPGIEGGQVRWRSTRVKKVKVPLYLSNLNFLSVLNKRVKFGEPPRAQGFGASETSRPS